MRRKLRFDEQARSVLQQLGLVSQRTRQQIHFDGAHCDAGESLFILQQLQAIEQGLYETPFGPLESDRLIPMDMSVPAGASEWGYDRVTATGLAQWLAADARDFASVEVERKRVTFPINSMGAEYWYTRLDLLAAEMSRMPLEPSLARAARRAIDSFRDQVLLQGDAGVGYSGFVNDPSVSVSPVAHGAWDGSAATADQIIAEINTDVELIRSVCKKVYSPDTLVVPPQVYAHLTTTARSTTSDTTIWEFIKKNNPYLKNLESVLQIAPVSEPGGIGPGVAGVGRALYYKRDPEVVVAKIAILVRAAPPRSKA
jgi:hypothetical protein